ncbi:phospholipase D family protein [Sphingomonas sp. PvP018]|uniref:phospholipase D family protein n=1 Tax=Sphingomonas sp. PvP018 TaxID=2817852 RepID=UPI001AE2D9FA|nr:phospholipase D family protein [Sphingomonas sp. PvP018]MBP2513840.1 HKD family nuclease [Sphingomonas sp. PvP018]
MHLVQNLPSDNHGDALGAVFEGAGRISVAVAFLKYGGAKIIGPLLEARLEAGATVEAFIGSDFYITEPKALTHLLAIAKRFEGFELFLADRAKASFHPKLYVGRSETQVRCLVRSANLTGGAMATNEEASLQAAVDPDAMLSTDLEAAFQRYRGDARFHELDDLVLGQYASRHKQAERLRRRLEKELEANLTSQFDLRRLDEYHAQYLADDDLSEALEKRREDRAEALKVQRSIAGLSRTPKLSRADKAAFADGLGNLISSKGGYRHLWHSGDIHRRGSEALLHPRRTIDLFAEGRKAAKLGPEAGYEKLRRIALDIPGVGVNMITEILCTFAPGRYAVFNGNTSGALAAIGVAAPRNPTLTGLSGARYAGLCATIDALRDRIDGADFTDADAFLNWLYFRTKPAKPVDGK